MKALIVSLLFPVLLKSCDGSADQIGRRPDPIATNPPPSSPSGNANGTGTGSSTDVPIDGGLTILLAAGAAYGVKRYRDSRKKATDSSS